MPERPLRNFGQRRFDLSSDEGVVLREVFLHKSLSRTDLTRITNFSGSKISGIVAKLLDRGILQEVDRSEDDHSKWKNLAINPQSGYLVGLDIGTTSIDVALLDFSCALISQISVATDVRDGPVQVLGEAVGLLNKLLWQLDAPPEKILGIGVGVPGPVSYPSGEVIGGQFTPGWEGYRIQEIFSEHFLDALIKLDNDANLMAIGSHKVGLAQKKDNFIFVKIGTGIGAGIYCRGQLFRGATSCAGHIGHTNVRVDGPVCRCGNRGCLEALAGGPAIAAEAENAVLKGKSEILARIKNKNKGKLTAVQVGEAAALHDLTAQEIIRKSALLIGSVLAGVVNLYNPELIVLGGGIAKIGDLLLAEIRREVLKRTYSYTTMGLQIAFSPIVDTAGVFGAAHFVRDFVFTIEGNQFTSSV